jgi:hypothetical protein
MLSKIEFVILEVLPDDVLLGFYRFKDAKDLVRIGGDLIMKGYRAKLVASKIPIIDDANFDTVASWQFKRLHEALAEKGIKVQKIENLWKEWEIEQEKMKRPAIKAQPAKPVIIPIKIDKPAPSIEKIIQKDISASIISPAFVPVVFDPTMRGNRKPRFHYRFEKTGKQK